MSATFHFVERNLHNGFPLDYNFAVDQPLKLVVIFSQRKKLEMRKKSKNRSQSVWSRFKQYLRDRFSEKLRQLILSCFACLAPCWNFLFLDKSKIADETIDNGPTNSKSPRLEKQPSFSAYEIHSHQSYRSIQHTVVNC